MNSIQLVQDVKDGTWSLRLWFPNCPAQLSEFQKREIKRLAREIDAVAREVICETST